MTDDKTQRVAELAEAYSSILYGTYKDIMKAAKKDKLEISTEDARNLSISAFIAAQGVVHPRYQGRGRGGGKGPNYDNPNPISDGFAWWIRNRMSVALLEKFGDREKVNEYVQAVWLEHYPNTPFEEDVNKWTTGQATRIRNVTEERHPDLLYEGQSIWTKKERK